MTPTRSFVLIAATTVFLSGDFSSGQSLSSATPLSAIESSDLGGQLQERQQKVEQLSAEERQTLLETRKKALEDPAVKEAFKARDKAAAEFNAAVYASMLQSDPTLAGALQKALGPSAPQQ